jgi:hypothetical protein
MKFTFWSVGLPFLLVGLQLAMRSPADRLPFGVGFSLALTVWFWCGVPCAILYWIVRLVRHAWGNGGAAQPAQPAIEYSEPDSGRIFGRLS